MKAYSNLNSYSGQAVRLLGLKPAGLLALPKMERRDVANMPRSARPHRQVTESLKQSIIEQYVAGTSMNELARIFGIRKATIADLVDGAGARRERRLVKYSLTPAQVEEAGQLRSQGQTFREIGEHFGVHLTTVWKALERHEHG